MKRAALLAGLLWLGCAPGVREPEAERPAVPPTVPPADATSRDAEPGDARGPDLLELEDALGGTAVPRRGGGERLGRLGASYRIGTARPASAIGDIWLDETQCGWKGDALALVLSPHPDHRALLAERAFTFSTGDVRVAFPQLPGVASLDVRIQPGDTSRGVRDEIVAFSDSPGNPIYAAVVRSELPAALRADAAAIHDSILRDTHERSQKIPPADIAVRDLDGPWGPVVEVLVRNQAATTCFPVSWYRQRAGRESMETVGVNRQLARHGALIDVALIVATPEDLPESRRADYARERMDEFMGSISLR